MEEILNPDRKKMVVYTALFGNYDRLIDPRQAYDGCDFICFTDKNDLQTQIWKQIKVETGFASPVIANRHFKWLSHRYFKNYNVSLCLDSNIILYTDPVKLAARYLDKYDIAMPKHPLRDCLYDEAVACIAGNKVALNRIFRQIVSYRSAGFPPFAGLMEQNIILRRHNRETVARIMESVWKELEKWGNYRDQLAFPYIAWRQGVNVCPMEENARNNREFVYLPHQQSLGLLKKAMVILKKITKRKFIDANLLKFALRFVDLQKRFSFGG
ncbi:conserved hypothetical protein [delta proteobacterium NaphS2]|nr:conserved hypothetical protein [delta proteobacterium NaphS2]